jgi:hypothetical protein
MLLRRIGWSLWVALAAAWLIAAGPLLDAAAPPTAVVCRAPAPREIPSDHEHAPGCCLIGCPTHAPMAAPPDVAGLEARQPSALAPTTMGADKGFALSPERSQRQPRAPPRMT